MSQDTQTPETAEEFVAKLFECEYCAECGGDAKHHEVISDFPFPGTFFARCKFGPNEDTGAYHPVIAAFHTENDTGVVSPA